MASKQISTSSKTAWQTASTTRPVNQLQSSIYVKKLVAMSISHIVYLRGLLPEEAFMDREMDGVPVKIIYEKSQFAPAVQIVEWIKGAFEAFDKKFLERLEFLFFVDGPNELILESYSFMFTYDDGQVTVTCGTKETNEPTTKFRLDEIRFATVQLLRHTSMLIQNMRKISENLSMKVRLYYYDDVTPDDYEPPGFEKAPDSEYVFEPSNIKLRHGKVDTGFHSVKLSSRIGLSRIREQNELSDDVRYLVETAQKKKNGYKTCGDGSNEDPNFETTSKDFKSAGTKVNLDDSVPMDISLENEKNASQDGSCIYIKETPTDVQNASVHCACGVSEDEGLLVFCDICRRWNHAVCYRFLDEKSVPSHFCCIFCHNSSPEAQCNDQSLITLLEKDVKIICLYRRALAFCLSSWRVDQRILSSELSVSTEIADQIISMMEADKVFCNKRKRGKGPYHHINLTHLKEKIIPEYFEKARVQLPAFSKSPKCDENYQNDQNSDVVNAKQRKINQSSKVIKIQPRK